MRRQGNSTGQSGNSEDTLRAAVEGGFPRERCFHAGDHQLAAKVVSDWIEDGDVVLVKGSRGMRMEQIVKKLKGEEE